jgi:hypothetical protein
MAMTAFAAIKKPPLQAVALELNERDQVFCLALILQIPAAELPLLVLRLHFTRLSVLRAQCTARVDRSLPGKLIQGSMSNSDFFPSSV